MKSRNAIVDHEINLMHETADNELRSIGEDQVAYISMVCDETLADISSQLNGLSDFTELWGVYSASGELLVVCDSPLGAWEYADENDLKAVRTH